MDIALLFFLPLIGGFSFATNFIPLRYGSAREETQRLYYRAAVYGVLLAALGALLHLKILSSWPLYQTFKQLVSTQFLLPLFERPQLTTASFSMAAVQVRADLALVCTWALVLGCSWPLWNGLLRLVDRVWVDLIIGGGAETSLLRRLNQRAIKDEFELLLVNALTQQQRVQVTLTNGKVYVGSVLESLDPASPKKHFRLQPWMSGHRSSHDGQVRFTTFYSLALDRAAEETDSPLVRSFQLVIPLDKVITISGFDLEAYLKFAEEQENLETLEADDSPAVTQIAGEVTVQLKRAKTSEAAAK